MWEGTAVGWVADMLASAPQHTRVLQATKVGLVKVEETTPLAHEEGCWEPCNHAEVIKEGRVNPGQCFAWGA
jgi:hypothetical protein